MDPIDNIHLNELLGIKKLTKESVNFCDWVHDLRSTLRGLGVEHVLDTEVLAPDGEYSPLGDEEYQVYMIMMERLSSELSDSYPHYRPFRLMEALKARFSMQLCHGHLKLYAKLLRCKLNCLGPLREHKNKFTEIMQKLKDIGYPIPEKLAVDTLLMSLPSHYFGFVACYNLMEVEKTVEKFFQMHMSADMDIFIHAVMTAPKDKDKWQVHTVYKSYTSY